MIDLDEVAELRAQAQFERRMARYTQLDPRDPDYIDPDDFLPPQKEKQMNHPAIGQPFPEQGGIFAGLARGHNGAPDYYLIVGPELASNNWDAAGEAAAELEVDEHTDFVLPTRVEQSLLFANVPELFESAWYWSSEQHVSNPDYAWMQSFGFGSQDDGHKSNSYRARAVRRSAVNVSGADHVAN